MNRNIFDTLTLRQKIEVLNAHESLRASQQIMWQAFEATGDLDLKNRFERIRAEYVEYAEALGAEVKPVFTETMFNERMRETYRRLGEEV